ncbi:MAG: phosphoribosyltransferase family protein, partial [Chloroflexota bacterium]|nr:phosphoribosyltransferase family protein [Chloroflexota bacterium]
PSHTKGQQVELMVAPKFLSPEDRVLIIDDFLATGNTINALIRIVHQSGATLVGIGAIIEKSFEGGRAALEELGVPVESLVVIADMSDGRIVFAE